MPLNKETKTKTLLHPKIRLHFSSKRLNHHHHHHHKIALTARISLTLSFIYRDEGRCMHGRITIVPCLTLYSRKGLKLLWCEKQTDRGRQRQTAKLTYNFSWPYHAVIFRTPLSTSASELRSQWAAAPRRAVSVTASWHWLKTHTDSEPHVTICIYLITFPSKKWESCVWH